MAADAVVRPMNPIAAIVAEIINLFDLEWICTVCIHSSKLLFLANFVSLIDNLTSVSRGTLVQRANKVLRVLT